MLVVVPWKLGHPGHGNRSHPSAWCDVHATQHRAAFVAPSPKHLCITCTDTVHNGDDTSRMISGSWTCWHLHCKSHHALKTHKHSDKIAPSVAWTARNTAVCVQQGTPGIRLLLLVLEWPSYWSFSCTPPPPLPIPLHYTKQSQIKHRLT